jgi:alkanesulfonate monooxygenase SsuD/methylene tetrahydromethanopterin reductase-like flavin-dependent oxidoreductase (luciferase family)
LPIWERSAPYDIDFPGNRFKVTTRHTQAPEISRGEMFKPFQSPRPEIVGTVVAPFSKGVIAMGQRDFHPLSANFLLPQYLASHWTNYTEGKRLAGQTPDPAHWRIARTIFVADDENTAQAYGRRDAASPYRFYWDMLLTKMMRGKRHIIFKTHEGQSDAELTTDYLVDRLVIAGTVDSVVDQLLALREQAGPFGELVYAGMDWVDERLARRSMELMANEVMPRFNAALRRG